jgi:hypothetical protein
MKDLVGYGGAHWRVRAVHGRAVEQECRHCGRAASHWAYDNADPAEQRHSDGRRYSSNPDHYLPLCVSCHKKHDAAVNPPKNPWDTRGRKPCGTSAGYSRGCRCDGCRTAATERMRAYRVRVKNGESHGV